MWTGQLSPLSIYPSRVIGLVCNTCIRLKHIDLVSMINPAVWITECNVYQANICAKPESVPDDEAQRQTIQHMFPVDLVETGGIIISAIACESEDSQHQLYKMITNPHRKFISGPR